MNKGPCLRHPLLIILDRDVDLISPLQHSSHYQVRFAGCLPCSLSSTTCFRARTIACTFPTLRPSISIKARTISGTNTPVLSIFSLLILDALFPDAIEANKSRMDDIVKRVESVRSMTSGSAPAGHQTSTLSALSASHSAAEERRGVASRASGAEKGAGEAHDDYERYAEDAVREC